MGTAVGSALGTIFDGGSKDIPERVIFLVGERAALDRPAEIQHGAGLRIEHRPLWQADAVRIAGGREIHPKAGHGGGKVAIFLGPRPFMRDEIAEHVGELGAMIGTQVFAEIFDIVLVRRRRRRVLEVIVEQLGLSGAGLRSRPLQIGPVDPHIANGRGTGLGRLSIVIRGVNAQEVIGEWSERLARIVAK